MKQIVAYKSISGKIFENKEDALLDDENNAYENQFEKLLIKANFPENYGTHFYNWDCENSPVKKCVYDWDDFGDESCIFCGEPEERK